MNKVPKGKAAADSTLTIVEREFELGSNRGESKVFARVRRPVPDTETTFRCEVELEGLGDPIATSGIGVDGVQAYELALQGAALRLLSSSEYQSGRLTFRGSHDIRLPVPESYRYLVRTDLERDLTVREMAGKDVTTKRFVEENLARLEDKSRVWPDKPDDAPVVLERNLRPSPWAQAERRPHLLPQTSSAQVGSLVCVQDRGAAREAACENDDAR